MMEVPSKCQWCKQPVVVWYEGGDPSKAERDLGEFVCPFCASPAYAAIPRGARVLSAARDDYSPRPA
jgi:uncharacterized protein CbrC (UPF0167 family)